MELKRERRNEERRTASREKKECDLKKRERKILPTCQHSAMNSRRRRSHVRLSLPARTTSNALLKKAKGDEGTMGPDVGEERESLRAIVCRPRC